MSRFLYPRRIDIRRPNPTTGVGSLSYSGSQASEETVIASGLAAHIQADRLGPAPVAKLPADAAKQSMWKIIFKAANGLVREKDIIVDDLGKRYQVTSAYWNPLVTTCQAQLLET